MNQPEDPEVRQHMLHLLYLSGLILKTKRWTVDECRQNMVKVREADAVSGRLSDSAVFMLRDLAVDDLIRLFNEGVALLPEHLRVDLVKAGR